MGKAPMRIRPPGTKKKKGSSIRVTPKKASYGMDSTKLILSETGEVLLRGTEAQWRKWVRKRKKNGSYEAELKQRYGRAVF